MDDTWMRPPLLPPHQSTMVESQSMPTQNGPQRLHKGRGRASKSNAICKTCKKCRAKKVKCDGKRPSCALCVSSNYTCTYPEDARRSGRLTKAEVEALQTEVSSFRQLLNARGGQPVREETPLGAALVQDVEIINPSRDTRQINSSGIRQSPQARQRLDLRSPSYGDAAQRDRETRIPGQDIVEQQHPSGNTAFYRPAPLVNGTRSNETGQGTRLPVSESPRNRESVSDGPSPFETQVACAIAEDGSIQVHGISSNLYQPSATRKTPIDETAQLSEEEEADSQRIKDQLFANAALQRQRETTIFGGVGRSLGPKIDLDGLPSDLAIHLLDLHWNRQHYAYLLTYRPAIIDSLTNDGPYANKLLLNSIYYSSCLYSDRAVFRADPGDPQSMGDNFYRRFKVLLMDEIDRPSLPTIVALLLCGTTLVSNGKQSGGWVLCGIAYKMIIDLGCHLSVSSHRTIAKSRLTALEIEIRTRVYWGAFLTDKFQSLYLGRPPTLRPSEARVSKVLRDYYEELENWTPYVDSDATSSTAHLTAYQPRPTYAISTFQTLIPLGEIAYSIASTFYSIDSIAFPTDHLLRVKFEIQEALDAWRSDLPLHLQFDPAVDPTPPPNQITPHATYHTLTILLERPFLSNGHLSSSSDSASQAAGEAKCANAAVRIWHLVDAYKSAFTLRRTPYLLSYATYSAIVILLNQKHTLGSQYVDCIRFFWVALLDLQRGCNSGLGKPLKILQTLMQRLGQNIPDWDPKESYPPAGQIDAPLQTQNSMGQKGYEDGGEGAQHSAYRHVPGLDQLLQQSLELENWDNGNWMDTIIDDQGLMDDSLFGLFTPGQPSFDFGP